MTMTRLNARAAARASITALANFTSWSLGLGNDFMALYFRYKVYLLDSLAGGHFPLWSPSEGAGYPFFSNPFTSTFILKRSIK